MRRTFVSLTRASPVICASPVTCASAVICASPVTCARPVSCASAVILALATACAAPTAAEGSRAPAAETPAATTTTSAPESRLDVPTNVADDPAQVAEPIERRDTDSSAARRDLALPVGWDTLTLAEFEAALAPWNPDGAPGRLDPDALVQLGRALDGDPSRAVRAVLLLASSASPEAWDVLLSRLERRIRTATDAFPAADLAAAAALARARDGSSYARAAKLAELARGRSPHPLFVVRVECAAASLALGREDVTAFLTAVLREGTPSQDVRPGWVRAAITPDALAFAQWRAVEALVPYAEVARTYRPELSAFDRERIAGDIERALASRSTVGGHRL